MPFSHRKSVIHRPSRTENVTIVVTKKFFNTQAAISASAGFRRTTNVRASSGRLARVSASVPFSKSRLRMPNALPARAGSVACRAGLIRGSFGNEVVDSFVRALLTALNPFKWRRIGRTPLATPSNGATRERRPIRIRYKDTVDVRLAPNPHQLKNRTASRIDVQASLH